MMETSDLQTCCAALAGALGCRAAGDGGGTFLVVEGEGGALFYKVGHAFGGQFTSAFTEPLAFCPFCGSAVGERRAARAAGAAGPEDESTRWRLGETQEMETVVAALAARGAGAAIHLSDF